MGSTLIYAAVCWTAPKLVGSIMGGSPSLTGGDLIATGVAAAAAGLTAVAALASGGAAAAGALAEVSAATAVAGDTAFDERYGASCDARRNDYGNARIAP